MTRIIDESPTTDLTHERSGGRTGGDTRGAPGWHTAAHACRIGAARLAATAITAAALWATGCDDTLRPPTTDLPAPGSLRIVKPDSNSGDAQHDTVLATLTAPLRVVVLWDGEPQQGVTVRWTVPEGHGSVSQQSTTTDADGIAAVTRVLGPTPGEQITEATLDGAADSPVTFTSLALDPLAHGVVSDPLPVGPPPSAGRDAAFVAEDSVAYVSLPPGAFPGGRSASVSTSRWGEVTTDMADGGFDPVPIPARAGEVLTVLIELVDGTSQSFAMRVPAARRPIVVRTDPPPKKRDIPLNAALIVIVSEPVDGRSLADSAIRLYQGSTIVPGTATVLPGTGVAIAFTPAADLEANTDYRLEVTRAVTDLDGDSLAAGQSVEFTSGSAPSGLAASINLSPDTVYMGATPYQMTVTVRDADGNQLIGEPVTWATSDPVNLEVTQTGLLTARTSGSYWVRAALGDLEATAGVSVSLAGSAATVTVWGPDSIALGDSKWLSATVTDAAGNWIPNPSVTWRSSDNTVLAAASATPAPGHTAAAFTAVGLGTSTITASAPGAQGSITITVAPSTVGSVSVTPDSLTLGVEDSRWLHLVVRDLQGDSISALGTCWYHSNPDVARLEYTGFQEPEPCVEGHGGGWTIQGFPDRIGISGVSTGSAFAVAINEGRRDTVFVTVTPRRTPVSLSITPDSVTLWTFSRRLEAVAVDAEGVGVSYRPTIWTSGDPAIAMVDSTGTVRAVATGTTTITATREGLTATATVVVPSYALSAISAGGAWLHTCGVTGANAVYCWGFYDEGDAFHHRALYLGGGLNFTLVTSGDGNACGLTNNGSAYCWNIDYVPVDLSGGGPGVIKLDSLNAPRWVSAGLTFVSLDAGAGQTCALTADGAAYCWSGYASPTLVPGGIRFTAITAGTNHTCGLTPEGEAYCWGFNAHGQLGDSTTNARFTPTRVAGGLTFLALEAGYAHTCGLAPGGRAYCWGANGSGELGDGTSEDRVVPTAVVGDQTFVALTTGLEAYSTTWTGGGYYSRAGTANTCGLTAGGEAWCWGENSWGQLGDGSTINRSIPTPMAGNLRFSALSAGGSHTCGTTPDGFAYCWGLEYGTEPRPSFGPPWN